MSTVDKANGSEKANRSKMDDGSRKTIRSKKDNGSKRDNTSGTIADSIKLGQKLDYNGQDLLPVGWMRFSCEYQGWEEYWCLTKDGAGLWLCSESATMAIQKRTLLTEPIVVSDLKFGAHISFRGQRFIVAETGEAVVTASEGTNPEGLREGDTFGYSHLTAADGQIVTFETLKGKLTVFEGHWINPSLLRIKGGAQ